MKATYQNRYKSLLNSLNAGIVVHDTDSRIIDYNQKDLELLKLSTAVEQSPVSVVITDTQGQIEPL